MLLGPALPSIGQLGLVSRLVYNNYRHWSETRFVDTHHGPIITYIAAAPSDITKWSPGTRHVPMCGHCYYLPTAVISVCSAVWAKISQSGYSNGAWATDTLIASQSIYKFTIPSSLKPGQYLVRHEIIGMFHIISSTISRALTDYLKSYSVTCRLVEFSRPRCSADVVLLFRQLSSIPVHRYILLIFPFFIWPTLTHSF